MNMNLKKIYPHIKKIEFENSYSSNLVEKIPIDELKQIIQNTGLIDK